MLDASMLSDVLPGVRSLAGVLAMGLLRIRSSRAWWRRAVPASWQGCWVGAGRILVVGFAAYNVVDDEHCANALHH
jgi:hypothetical protein